jgi:Shikimate kinase
MSSRFIKNDPAALAAYIKSLGQGLVLFDGRPTAGKTTLAKQMATRLRCGVVDGDAFVIRKQGQFISALKIADLRQSIESALVATPLVLLSTVCAREVATKIDMGPVSWVWIERTSLTLLEIAVRDFADDFDADQPAADDTLRQEVEAYIKAHDARGRADKVYFNAPPEC